MTSDSIDLNLLYPPLAKYVPHRPSDPQALFLLIDQREAFYGGAAGGGKSDALLMAALQYVDIPDYAALILRRTFPELRGSEGLLFRARQWLGGTDAVFNEQQHVWTFPSGAVLQFGHVANEGDMSNYDGQAYQFVGFDELTHFTEAIYDHVGFTRTRRGIKMKDIGIPIRTRATAMPDGAGYGWVKRRFITHRKPGVPYVPARVWDNPGLDVDEYAQNSLGHLPEEKRKRLLNGDWDIFLGAALPDFDQHAHCVSDFPLSPDLRRLECADYGLNGMAWYLLVSDYEGNLIFHDGVYCKDQLPSEVAPLLHDKHHRGWGLKNDRVADSTLWRRNGSTTSWGQPASIVTEFEEQKITLRPANNDPRAGLMRLRELVRRDPAHNFPAWHSRRGEPNAPRLYVNARNCPELVEALSTAPLQPQDKRDGGEIVDPDWESHSGHSFASARYGALAWPDMTPEPMAPALDPRAEALRIYEEKMESRAPRRKSYVNA